jgi:hypothetical protein
MPYSQNRIQQTNKGRVHLQKPLQGRPQLNLNTNDKQNYGR